MALQKKVRNNAGRCVWHIIHTCRKEHFLPLEAVREIVLNIGAKDCVTGSWVRSMPAGFRGEIISTHATRALLLPMLRDAVSFSDQRDEMAERGQNFRGEECSLVMSSDKPSSCDVRYSKRA